MLHLRGWRRRWFRKRVDDDEVEPAVVVPVAEQRPAGQVLDGEARHRRRDLDEDTVVVAVDLVGAVAEHASRDGEHDVEVAVVVDVGELDLLLVARLLERGGLDARDGGVGEVELTRGEREGGGGEQRQGGDQGTWHVGLHA
ncbi:MAG: hypothetical protein H6733_06395 [Alphaproteobacteria bacterium]|nr:hypothetical protein [Alphaproteobacteria bacterium]